MIKIMDAKKLDRIKGCLVGLAVGDALGVHHEFKQRKDVVPITDYTEGNPYGIPIGYWTDDTSMALCMAQSLVEKNEFDAMDIMQKFCQWLRKGYMSSTHECFDIGNTTRTALMQYWRLPESGPYCGPTDVYSAGNGSIMRLAPIPMFFHDDIIKSIYFAGESSRITHGYIECVEGCRLLSELIWKLINFDTLYSNFKYSNNSFPNLLLYPQFVIPRIVLKSKISEVGLSTTDSDVKGTGYVYDSLNASLWACNKTFSFEEAVLKAVNLGDDADTTGAVTGQLAGAYYGYDAIPQHWKDKLRHHDMIVELAEKLANIK